MIEVWTLTMCLTATCGQPVVVGIEPTEFREECVRAAEDWARAYPGIRFVCRGSVAESDPVIRTREIIVGPGDTRSTKDLMLSTSYHAYKATRD